MENRMPGHVAQQRSPRPDNFRAVGLEEPCYARQTFFLQTNQLTHCIGHLGDRTEMSHDFYSQEDTTGMMYGARQTWLHYKISICIISSSATIVPLTLSFSPLHRHLQSQPLIFCDTTGTSVLFLEPEWGQMLTQLIFPKAEVSPLCPRFPCPSQHPCSSLPCYK